MKNFLIISISIVTTAYAVTTINFTAYAVISIGFAIEALYTLERYILM